MHQRCIDSVVSDLGACTWSPGSMCSVGGGVVWVGAKCRGVPGQEVVMNAEVDLRGGGGGGEVGCGSEERR